MSVSRLRWAVFLQRSAPGRVMRPKPVFSHDRWREKSSQVTLDNCGTRLIERYLTSLMVAHSVRSGWDRLRIDVHCPTPRRVAGGRLHNRSREYPWNKICSGSSRLTITSSSRRTSGSTAHLLLTAIVCRTSNALTVWTPGSTRTPRHRHGHLGGRSSAARRLLSAVGQLRRTAKGLLRPEGPNPRHGRGSRHRRVELPLLSTLLRTGFFASSGPGTCV